MFAQYSETDSLLVVAFAMITIALAAVTAATFHEMIDSTANAPADLA